MQHFQNWCAMMRNAGVGSDPGIRVVSRCYPGDARRLRYFDAFESRLRLSLAP